MLGQPPDSNNNGATPSLPASASVPPPPTEPNPSVTYNSTLEDNRRCMAHITRYDRRLPIVIYTLALAVALLATRWMSPIGLMLLFFTVVSAGYGLVRFLNTAALQQRFPTPDTVRVCTSTLLPRGFHDVTPDGTSLKLWTEVTSVALYEGDLYVMFDAESGYFVPRGAFENEEAGRRFYKAAHTLWVNARAEAERQNKEDNWDGTQANR